jgi:hypothetical protein
MPRKHNLSKTTEEMARLKWDYVGIFEFFSRGEKCNCSYGGRNGTFDNLSQAIHEVRWTHDSDSEILHFVSIGSILTHQPNFSLPENNKD